MASHPGESQQFGFEPGEQLFYDHMRVADEVMLPLVESYWPVEWERSAVSDVMGLRMRGSHSAKDFDASLQAYNCMLDEEEHEFTAVFGIEVEELVVDEKRDMLMSLAEAQGAKFKGRDPDDILFKLGAAYAFNPMGFIEVEKCQTVSNVAGEIIWTSSLAKLTETAVAYEEFVTRGSAEKPVLQEDDMDRLESGIYVLRATDAIKAALEAIRAEPIF